MKKTTTAIPERVAAEPGMAKLVRLLDKAGYTTELAIHRTDGLPLSPYDFNAILSLIAGFDADDGGPPASVAANG